MKKQLPLTDAASRPLRADSAAASVQCRLFFLLLSIFLGIGCYPGELPQVEGSRSNTVHEPNSKVFGVREMSLNPGVQAVSLPQFPYYKQENQTCVIRAGCCS